MAYGPSAAGLAIIRATPIKSLHITNAYHPSSGGIRTFYLALLAAAEKHRRLVRLVVPGPEDGVQEIGEFGRIYSVAAPRAPVLDSRYRMMLPNKYAWGKDTALRKILAAERPQLVEICDKFSLCYLSGVLRREWIPGVPVPAIVGLTCERLDNNVASYFSASYAAELLSEYYMRWCYVPRFDFHIAVSDYIAGEIRRVLPARLGGRLYVCPMGVDVEFFSKPRDASHLRRELLNRCGGNDSTVLLLYAGRISKEKNLLLLAGLMEKLAKEKTDFRLLIAGSGPFKEDLSAALEKTAPDRHLYIGHLQTEELADLFHAADIFLHPNPREPFGIAPLEAMSAGLPLVAPASGGLLTYANEENSWLTDNSATGFAAAVKQVVQDPHARQLKTALAVKTAERFSWAKVTANYFQLYDALHQRFRDEDFEKGSAEESGMEVAVCAGSTG